MSKEFRVQADGWQGTLDDHQRQVGLPIAEAYFAGDEKEVEPRG